MTEPTLRLLLVAVAAVLAVGVGVVSGRGAALRRRRLTDTGLEPGIYLFSSPTCTACETVHGVLDRVVPGRYVTVDWPQDEDRFTALAVDKVPTVVRVNPDGAGWKTQGVISERRARRWLDP